MGFPALVGVVSISVRKNKKGVSWGIRTMCIGHHKLCINVYAWRKGLCPHGSSGLIMTVYAFIRVVSNKSRKA
jgi:hypothetical protein